MASRVNLKSEKTKVRMVEKVATNIRFRFLSGEEVATDLITLIANKIHEKPEDVAWFIEVKAVMDKLGTGEFSEKTKPESLKTSKSVQAIMSEVRKSYKKFKRIEAKMKKAGLV
ncbi:hypothetical protein APY94_03005 [Thermococcus celericrescens]|uniref:Uncharacterized protein n=1 Tax=Thermococcus celericrescens TaxID=227598 RepID=A0A100XZ32_9EURY|nr:hypothetical protein [Thermococcus celericrescens]KUH34259.1 hypothetical protein APY94_03005 [Thermococcus celericrescens]